MSRGWNELKPDNVENHIEKFLLNAANYQPTADARLSVEEILELKQKMLLGIKE